VQGKKFEKNQPIKSQGLNLCAGACTTPVFVATMLLVLVLFAVIDSTRGSCATGTQLYTVFLADVFGDGWNGEN
jgi:hypothetical protein